MDAKIVSGAAGWGGVILGMFGGVYRSYEGEFRRCWLVLLGPFLYFVSGRCGGCKKMEKCEKK